MEGETPSAGDLSEPEGFARDLAAFIVALRGLSTEGAPTSPRGTRSLALLDAPTRAAIAASQDLIDTAAATAAWEAALRVPEWCGPHLWVHADLLPGNLLTRQGRLGAVIDFGSVGVGDPASDVSVAWSLLLPGGPDASSATLWGSTTRPGREDEVSPSRLHSPRSRIISTPIRCSPGSPSTPSPKFLPTISAAHNLHHHTLRLNT